MTTTNDIEYLLAKLQWMIVELDDVRAEVVRLHAALERTASAPEQPRTAPVAAFSPFLVPIDTSALPGLSERLLADDWLARRGNIPLQDQLFSTSLSNALTRR